MKIVLTPEEKAAKKAAKKAAWLATPIARVERPLRYLRGQLNTKDEKVTLLFIVHPAVTVATRIAKRGDGKSIHSLALFLAQGGYIAPIEQEKVSEEAVVA